MTSIVEVASVPECDREPGKVSKVKWQDGSAYPAQIIKLSKCMKTLNNAEKKFLDKYNGLQSDGSKRQAKAKPVDPSVATALQLARALGERVQLPPQQAAEKAAILRQKRVDNANVKQTESFGDSLAFKSDNVSSAKRILQFGATDDVNLSGNEGNGSVSPGVDQTLDEDMHTPLKSNHQAQNPPVISDSCEKCKMLSSHINPASMEFLISLSKFCNVVPVSSNLSYTADGDSLSIGEVNHLQPLTVECGHKKVELTAGSGLFLKKASKSKAVLSANGDPDRLTREILTVLYGDKLRQPGISALGQGKQKLGIGETDLQNIFSFVCRNSKLTGRVDKKGKELPSFTFNAFIKSVNKKLKTASRDRMTSATASSKKNNSRNIVQQSPLASPLSCAGTPVKSWVVKDTSAGQSKSTVTASSETSLPDPPNPSSYETEPPSAQHFNPGYSYFPPPSQNQSHQSQQFEGSSYAYHHTAPSSYGNQDYSYHQKVNYSSIPLMDTFTILNL